MHEIHRHQTVERVRKTALSIAKEVQTSQTSSELQLDMLVIELAALFHDFLDKKYHKASSEDISPIEYFRPFFDKVAPLVDLRGDMREDCILRIIENISWTTEK